MSDNSIQLVIFDWAGTTVDHGCFAPVSAFIQTFANFGVQVSAAEARGPMGLHKKDHIRTMLEMPGIRQRWEQSQGRPWTEQDVEELFSAHFAPLQMEVAVQHSEPVAGLLEAVAFLRKSSIKLGTTTGYFREVAERVYAHAKSFGYEPDSNFCADDVPQARPAPWMIYRNMEALGVYPASRVVKIGDTVPDVQEGRNAGVWTVGVSETSSLVGLTESELQTTPSAERTTLVSHAAQTLRAAGAHDIIHNLTELPDLMGRLAARIQAGESPQSNG